MACRYAYLLPLWIAFLVHQVLFSSHFFGFREGTFFSTQAARMHGPY